MSVQHLFNHLLYSQPYIRLLQHHSTFYLFFSLLIYCFNLFEIWTVIYILLLILHILPLIKLFFLVLIPE